MYDSGIEVIVMARVPAIGKHDFSEIIEGDCFYVDKTNFIKEWWENKDKVTLITRPRRFGKTLMMNTVEHFFSVAHAGRGDLFEGLSIWEDEKFRELQGTYPVISLNFRGVKGKTYQETWDMVCDIIAEQYNNHYFLLDTNLLTPMEKTYFTRIANADLKKTDALTVLKYLTKWLQRYYGKRVIVLIDEYDTPMNYAYANRYWDEIVELFGNLFSGGLKDSPYLERAILTGITRVSKESVFSDLNNLVVVSVTSKKYATAFGFTEDEVFSALQEFGLEDAMDNVRKWYDGFRFGEFSGIYNPWSIINYLAEQETKAYWANTSSNDLVKDLIRRGDKSVKIAMEDLLVGKSLKAAVNEQVVFKQLDEDGTALWSLLLASGYLKAISVVDGMYELALTNREIRETFRDMVREWFSLCGGAYSGFRNALLGGQLDDMNDYLNTIVYRIISNFDSGTKPSETEPERFYHGLVLGLLIELEGRYVIASNRESGSGRYDVMLEPLNVADAGIIIEFKVKNPRAEKDLQDTVKAALKQIVENQYATELKKKVGMDRIRIYGFAFSGKNVLIDGGLLSEYEIFFKKPCSSQQ